VLSLRRRLALVRVRSLTAFARVVIRGTVLASLRSLAAGTVGGWVRFASLARDLVSDWCPRTPHRHAATHFALAALGSHRFARSPQAPSAVGFASLRSLVILLAAGALTVIRCGDFVKEG